MTRQEFLDRLEALCLESGFYLLSCGCCGGIWLERGQTENLGARVEAMLEEILENKVNSPASPSA